MASLHHQALIHAINIHAVWSGKADDTVNLTIRLEVEARPNSRLTLLHHANAAVTSWSVTNVTKTSAYPGSLSVPCETSIRMFEEPNQEDETPSSPISTGRSHDAKNLTISSNPLRDPSARNPRGFLMEKSQHVQHTGHPNSHGVIDTDILSLPFIKQTSQPPPSLPPDTFRKALYTHPGQESKIPRRINFASSRQQSLKKIPSNNSSLKKWPIPLTMRPPWQFPGPEDSGRTSRGFESFGLIPRKGSQSAHGELSSAKVAPAGLGSPRLRLRHLASRSMENLHKRDHHNCMVESDYDRLPPCGMNLLPHFEFSTTLPLPPTCATDFSSTGRPLEDSEPMSGRKVEQWLEDKRNKWEATTASETSIVVEKIFEKGTSASLSHLSEIVPCFPSSDEKTMTSLSDMKPIEKAPETEFVETASILSSPSPSSQAAVPWTKVRSTRSNLAALLHGGGLSGLPSGSSVPIVIANEGGFLHAVFSPTARHCLTHMCLKAEVRLQKHPNGGFNLEIPGLPFHTGDGEGEFLLDITAGAGNQAAFSSCQRVAYVDHALNVNTLEQSELRLSFPLRSAFSIRLLCFEEILQLDPSLFEIDYRIQEAYNWDPWTRTESNDIRVLYTIVCSLRLRDFLFYAELMKFTLYLRGGPAGVLCDFLEAGKRRIYVANETNDPAEMGEELQITLTCHATELSQPITIQYEKQLGQLPGQFWVPSLSTMSWEGFEFNHEIEREPFKCVLPDAPKQRKLPPSPISSVSYKDKTVDSAKVQKTRPRRKSTIEYSPASSRSPRSSQGPHNSENLLHRSYSCRCWRCGLVPMGGDADIMVDDSSDNSVLRDQVLQAPGESRIPVNTLSGKIWGSWQDEMRRYDPLKFSRTTNLKRLQNPTEEELQAFDEEYMAVLNGGPDELGKRLRKLLSERRMRLEARAETIPEVSCTPEPYKSGVKNETSTEKDENTRNVQAADLDREIAPYKHFPNPFSGLLAILVVAMLALKTFLRRVVLIFFGFNWLKAVILGWICCRAFAPDLTRIYENRVETRIADITEMAALRINRVGDMVGSGFFSGFHDPTGWKRLIETIDEGRRTRLESEAAANVKITGKVEDLFEQAADEESGNARIARLSGETKLSKANEGIGGQEEKKGEGRGRADDAPKRPVTFRDQVDYLLGWRGPNGDWE